jgi:hypothetical protein
MYCKLIALKVKYQYTLLTTMWTFRQEIIIKLHPAFPIFRHFQKPTIKNGQAPFCWSVELENFSTFLTCYYFYLLDSEKIVTGVKRQQTETQESKVHTRYIFWCFQLNGINHLSLIKFHLELWILSWWETIQLAYWQLVVLLRCPFMPEIMHRRAPEVFLHQYSWKVAIC